MLLAVLFVHGTFYAFLLNGFHELCHSTVFKTKSLNTLFLYVFSFLGWYNPVCSGQAIKSTTSTRCTRQTTWKSCCR